MLASRYVGLQIFGEAHRRNLPGQIDVLGQAHLAFLERAVKVSLLDSLTSICVLVDERDDAILDLKVHGETLANFLLEVARGLDAKCLATAHVLVAVGNMLAVKATAASEARRC